MARGELEVLWAAVRRQFDVATGLLPKPARSGEDGGTVEAYQDWLEHNELELALDELEALGDANRVSSSYWVALAEAARLMNLAVNESRLRSRITNSHPGAA